MGKLKPSNNHINRERNFTGSRYNFHSTISTEEKAQIAEAINNNEEIIPANIEPAAAKTIGALSPERTIDIKLEDLVPAPDTWNYFPLPEVEVLKDIAKSIYIQGQLSPALVWERDNGKYMILGGHTRYRILQFLKAQYPDEANRFSTMKCHVYGIHQINDEEAQYLIITNNMTQRARESTSIMIKSIVKALELQKSITTRAWGVEQERSNEIVAKNFGVSSSSVDRLYRLRTLIPPIIDMLDNSQITQQAALKIAILSEKIQTILYNGNYLTSHAITSDQFQKMKSADNEEDIRDILTRKLYPVLPKKILLDVPIPDDFEKISIAASKDDMDIIRNELRNISGQLSNETKNILLRLLRQ